MFKKYPTIRSRIAHLVTPGSLSERAISIASIVLICGICWLDSKTHSDIRLRILYMFPLAMLALHVRRGRTAFLGFALVASCEATSLVSNHLPFATRFIEALVAITGFLLVVVLARAVRDNYLPLRLRSTTLEAAANGIVITDRQGTIVWANQAFSTMTGYSKEEVLGKNPRLLKSGEQPESYYAELWSTISSGKVWQGEIVNRRKDGTTYTEEMTITPVTQDLGSATDTYFIAINQDITERKQAEESLLFKTALLEAQTETTIDGILAVDESDHIVLTNKQFGLNFGIPDELLNTRDDLIVRKHVTDKVEDPDAFIERIEYLNSHRNEKGRDELRFKNGKIFDRYSAPLVDSKARYRGRIWYLDRKSTRLNSSHANIS